MKNPNSQIPNPNIRSVRAMALVVVLGILVLLTGLIVALFSTLTSESTQSATYSRQAESQQLADSAVNIVTAQIADATRGYAMQSGAPNYNAPLAWASQPGAVRTWSVNGTADNIFKLYSAQRMAATQTEFSADLATDAPANWASNPPLFTDLNSPVRDESNLDVYPIVDPGALGTVEGFSVSGAPTTGTANPIPMPARWLYVLKDGTVTVPTGGSATTATWTGAAANLTPSKNNPIIGRIAFWTDDETAKVNINTASEGTYWDAPYVVTQSNGAPFSETNVPQDRDLARSQPARNEFQRYPGHPATTSLAPVLFASSANSTAFSLTQSQRDAIYQLSPRVAGGGSDAGTQVATGAINLGSPGRLYSHVDELVFNDARGSQVAAVGIDRQKLMRSKFFLTANSRAPETTLFNTPRVATWPLHSLWAPNPTSSNTEGMKATTAFDRLIAFCSTINGQPYYFQRESALSPTADINISRNIDLYAYLRRLTGEQVPGFGGKFSSKYPADRDQILTEIFDYIRCSNLGDDYVYAQDPTKVFTYNAHTMTFGNVNASLADGVATPARYTPPGGNPTMGFGRTFTISEAALGFICNADASVPSSNVTVSANATTGNRVLGATALSAGEKYIQAIFVPEFFSPMMGWRGMQSNFIYEISGLNALTVTVGSGTHTLFPDVPNGTWSWRGMPQPQWGVIHNGGWPSARAFALRQGSPARGNLTADPLDATNLAPYPFIGTPVKITPLPTDPTMQFSGGQVTINIYANPSPTNAVPAALPSSAYLVQTLRLNFPASTPAAPFPIPNLVSTPTPTSARFPDAGSYSVATTPENWWAFSRGGTVPGKPGRLANLHHAMSWMNTDSSGSFFRGGDTDVVRSILPRHGDFRLVAANPDLNDSGNTVFKAHRWYGDKTEFLAHNLTGPDNSGIPGYDIEGSYTSGVIFGGWQNNQADIPKTAAAADRPVTSRDFDNGIGVTRDGPYVNKPDEGNNERRGIINGQEWIPYLSAGHTYVEPGATFFTPNRLIPSPVMFGSLPTGVQAGVPWRTLLFRPQANHPSTSTTIPDHLLLDLFWMPVVEPYAISEPFSTAGKINMNYAIAPYSYISRKTGLVAALRSLQLLCIPGDLETAKRYKLLLDPYATSIKLPDQTPVTHLLPPDGQFRKPVNAQETLKYFDAKFASGEAYKSATEICDIPLVPQGGTPPYSYPLAATFWQTTFPLSGDNTRERPYAHLYGRLTTKSNTFTVHYKVQVLRQRSGSPDFAVWQEGKDVVLSEYRGSTILERYIDPNDPDLPDFATRTGGNTTRFPNVEDRMNMDNYYRIRTVATKRFAP